MPQKTSKKIFPQLAWTKQLSAHTTLQQTDNKNKRQKQKRNPKATQRCRKQFLLPIIFQF